MRVRNILLKNFRGIHEMEINLNNQLNVICGINGSGKSSILDAIVQQLSWIVARIRSTKSPGRPISKHDIKNNENYSLTKIAIEENNSSYLGQLVKYRKGRVGDEKSSMMQFSHYSKQIKQRITEDEKTSIPVIIYYSTNRIVSNIPLGIRAKNEFSLLEAYDGSLDAGVNFRSFFEWYRNREDLENEKYRDLDQNDLNFSKDIQLESVQKAISAMTDFYNITVKRNPLRMEVSKNDESLRIEQLSDGEKCLLAMAGDMARRLAIANPALTNPLEGNGVVLIDEIDLHLHPQWQKKIIPKLLKTFPHIQFIVSTHSPQVLSEIDKTSIFLLYQENKLMYISNVKQSKGLSSNEILEEIMNTDPLNQEAKDQLDTIFSLIENEAISDARREIKSFIDNYGTVPEITRATTLLSFYDEEL